MNASHIAKAFITACETEVRALKPGNVHIYASGHGMEVSDFERSARVAAPHIANAHLAVGARIKGAVEATFREVDCNTNLGIVLLCAPLAAAAEHAAVSGTSLHQALTTVLASFSDEDTRDVFSAIATANPGGIGTDNTADVRAAPPADITLLTAMQIAADRDLIAIEYVTGFARVFDLYATQYAPRVADGWSAEDAIGRTYVATLARVPDTHIARKYGAAAASAVMAAAKAVEHEVFSNPKIRPGAPLAMARLLSFDAKLKAQGHNPGSLADLMAAVLFVAGLKARLVNVPVGGLNPATSR